MEKISLTEYSNFVDGVTSEPSKDMNAFLERLIALDEAGLDVPRFITAATGLSDESGEFAGYMKKIVFHGKEYNDDMRTKLKGELGDVFWYLMNACMAINVDPNEVISLNVEKLKDRYPGGFSVWLSENRNAASEKKW